MVCVRGAQILAHDADKVWTAHTQLPTYHEGPASAPDPVDYVTLTHATKQSPHLDWHSGRPAKLAMQAKRVRPTLLTPSGDGL